MGRKPQVAPLPRGVTIRQFKTEERIQIAFRYRGVECRELLPPCQITKTRIDSAAGLRNEIRRKIGDGTFNYAAYFPNSSKLAIFSPAPKLVTVGDLLRVQQAVYEKQARDGNLSPSTLLGYVKVIKNSLLPRWEPVGIADVTKSDLREWIKGMDVTAKRVRNILTPLRSVFEDAVNDELITVNPLDQVVLGKLLKQSARQSDYEVDPFTADEIAVLLKHCRTDERASINFLFASGLRSGEFTALRVRSVDLKNRLVHVTNNIVLGMVEGKIERVEKAPKTGAGSRFVELDDVAVSALEAALEGREVEPEDFVWLNPRTGKPWSHESQFRRTLWVPLLDRSGLEYRNPYQTRHTYASTLLTAGRNPFWLANQMGHVDAEMVFKIYGKWIADNWQKARLALDSHALARASAERSAET